jgi:glutamate-1-semialdehyde 2,1-aminomutase
MPMAYTWARPMATSHRRGRSWAIARSSACPATTTSRWRAGFASEGAGYLAFGAFFPSPTKPHARRASLDLLRDSADLGLPRVAIGGITPDNAPSLVAAGADLLAVISGVFDAADPVAAARAYHSCFDTGIPHPIRMNTARSHDLFTRAQALMPGGVNSPVRAFKSVGGEPFFVQRADGPYLFDADGNRYIDYVGSWGPMIAGHNHPKVLEAVIATARNGLSFGTPNPLEVTMAETITRLIPSCEMVRMVNSGTEATLSAIRLARGATGRSRIVKFEGCYHGHGDSFLVKAGSGALTFGVPTSPGVPKAWPTLTLTLTYNDFDGRDQAVRRMRQRDCRPDRRAGGRQCQLPAAAPGYLQHLRDLCTRARRDADLRRSDDRLPRRAGRRAGALRRDAGPVDLRQGHRRRHAGGCLRRPRDLMQQIAPAGPIYQAGTLSGNPVAMAAGLAMLELVQAPGFHDALEAKTNALCDGLEAAARDAGIPFTTQRVGGMFGMFFSNDIVDTYAQAMACDSAAFNRFFHAMLERGVYLAPSAFEAGFMSSAHDEAAIADTIRAAGEAFRSL